MLFSFPLVSLILGCSARRESQPADWREIAVPQNCVNCEANVFVFYYFDSYFDVDQNDTKPYQILQLAYTNRGDETLSCTGNNFMLVCSKNEKWYEVPRKADLNADPAEYRVQLNKCSMVLQSYYMTDYYDFLPKGEYLLLIPLSAAGGETHQIGASFCIP